MTFSFTCPIWSHILLTREKIYLRLRANLTLTRAFLCMASSLSLWCMMGLLSVASSSDMGDPASLREPMVLKFRGVLKMIGGSITLPPGSRWGGVFGDAWMGLKWTNSGVMLSVLPLLLDRCSILWCETVSVFFLVFHLAGMTVALLETKASTWSLTQDNPELDFLFTLPIMFIISEASIISSNSPMPLFVRLPKQTHDPGLADTLMGWNVVSLLLFAEPSRLIAELACQKFLSDGLIETSLLLARNLSKNVLFLEVSLRGDAAESCSKGIIWSTWGRIF